MGHNTICRSDSSINFKVSTPRDFKVSIRAFLVKTGRPGKTAAMAMLRFGMFSSDSSKI